MDYRPKARRVPSEAARLAAVAKRREMAMIVKDKARPEVFVVRLPPPSRLFGWEIRRFGSVVLSRGGEGYPSLAEARRAGEAVFDLVL